jgi:hypothetical protein
MANLDDNFIEQSRELDRLRSKARDLRERGRKSLSKMRREEWDELLNNRSLSGQWVSGGHSIDLALVVRVLNNQDLSAGNFKPYTDDCHKALATLIERDFQLRISKPNVKAESQEKARTEVDSSIECDGVPILTAARAMHTLVTKSTTVFSAATMICYYQIVRELYLATFPNWIIGAARAGESGRVSAFVTGECVRAVLAFRNTIKDTITFFTSTKKLVDDLERLDAVSDISKLRPSFNSSTTWTNCVEHWEVCKKTEVERIVLDWYATNNLRRNVIALDCSPAEDPIFNVSKPTDLESIKRMLSRLPGLLQEATNKAVKEFENAKQSIGKFRDREKEEAKSSATQKRAFDATASGHALAFAVVDEALQEARDALSNGSKSLPAILQSFIDQYKRIYKRIGRVIEPAKRYIQDVLNRELAHAANSNRFDAGELLFAAASFGAITKWKQNAQLTDARKLLTDLLPEDGRFQTSHPIHSDLRGSQLMPIAFEMTRCFAQLMRKDFGEDLDEKMVRKLLNLFDNPINLAPGDDDTVGWNFGGAPESEKPSVWVTAVGVFAVDRIVRMLDERINAMVLRQFNVDWPEEEADPWAGILPKPGGKLNLSSLDEHRLRVASVF